MSNIQGKNKKEAFLRLCTFPTVTACVYATDVFFLAYKQTRARETVRCLWAIPCENVKTFAGLQKSISFEKKKTFMRLYSFRCSSKWWQAYNKWTKNDDVMFLPIVLEVKSAIFERFSETAAYFGPRKLLYKFTTSIGCLTSFFPCCRRSVNRQIKFFTNRIIVITKWTDQKGKRPRGFVENLWRDRMNCGEEKLLENFEFYLEKCRWKYGIIEFFLLFLFHRLFLFFFFFSKGIRFNNHKFFGDCYRTKIFVFLFFKSSNFRENFN